MHSKLYQKEVGVLMHLARATTAIWIIEDTYFYVINGEADILVGWNYTTPNLADFSQIDVWNKLQNIFKRFGVTINKYNFNFKPTENGNRLIEYFRANAVKIWDNKMQTPMPTSEQIIELCSTRKDSIIKKLYKKICVQ
jgi:hypothetical protein